jgi:hypothetical protein
MALVISFPLTVKAFSQNRILENLDQVTNAKQHNTNN